MKIEEMKTTAIIIVHNEMEYAKVCIESIKDFAEETDIIVVDNASEDGFAEWLSEQEDISYAVCERRESYPEVIRQVLEAFQIGENILLINPKFAITPGSLGKMKEALYSGEKVSVCGCGVYLEKERPWQKEVEIEGAALPHKMLGTELKIVLIKKSNLEKAGGFDTKYKSIYACWLDFLQQLLRVDLSCTICKNIACCVICSVQELQKDSWTRMDNADLERLEEKWGMHYFNFYYSPQVMELIQIQPEKECRVLEIGCDCGATLLEIKERYPNTKVFGVEINKSAVEVARHFTDGVRCANIEEKDLDYERHSFDYIIFGDVLEHLRNPKDALIYCKHFLKRTGKIVASIPNMMHISVMEDLLKGNFTYKEWGLLDKTHIHMFTGKEIVKMVSEAGYSLGDLFFVNQPITKKQEWLIDRLTELEPQTQKDEYMAFQYYFWAEEKREN